MTEKRKIKIAPSVLSADFGHIASEVKKAKDAGADMLHLDVMDGHFVPNITFGPFIVKAIRKSSDIPLVSHLMIENPKDYVKGFAEAGSDMIIFHIEAEKDPEALIRYIKSFNVKAGVSLKPKTSVSDIQKVLPLVEEVLVMTVEPGFGGQSFMPEPVKKISEIRRAYKGDIGVDGGINQENAETVVREGANVLIAGSYLFGKSDMKERIERMKGIGSRE